MQQERPTSVVVVGVVNIILGVINLSVAVCGGAGLLLFNSLSKSMPTQGPSPFSFMDYIDARLPGYLLYTVIAAVLGFIAGLVALFSGIGLFRMRPSARTLSMGYAVYLMISVAVNFVYQWGWVQPLMVQWQREVMPAARTAEPGLGVGNHRQPDFRSWSRCPANRLWGSGPRHHDAAVHQGRLCG